MPLILSHEVSRRYGEYPRARHRASARPTCGRRCGDYFDQLRRRSRCRRLPGRLFITSSDAGVMGVDEARQRTLRTLVSGCASGIAGAAAVGRAQGWKNIIAIDMGGTSFDAGIVQDGTAGDEDQLRGGGLRVPDPDGRARHDRGGRRQHRLDRRGRRAERRPAKRGRRSRARLLRPRRDGRDVHRRRLVVRPAARTAARRRDALQKDSPEAAIERVVGDRSSLEPVDAAAASCR